MQENQNETLTDEEISSVDKASEDLAEQVNSKALDGKNLLDDEDFLEKNVYANKRICEEIIGRYVVALQNGKPPMVMTSGGRGSVKIKSPATLKEAKILADAMFSKEN